MRAYIEKSERSCAIWVTLLPFLLFSILASGVMPSRTDNGTLTLVICSGHGKIEQTVDRITFEPIEKESDAEGDICPWSIARIAISSVDFPCIPLVDFRFTVVRGSATEIYRLAASIAGLPPSTGPPAFL